MPNSGTCSAVFRDDRSWVKSHLHKETASVLATTFWPLLLDFSCHALSLQICHYRTPIFHIFSLWTWSWNHQPQAQLGSRDISRARFPLTTTFVYFCGFSRLSPVLLQMPWGGGWLCLGFCCRLSFSCFSSHGSFWLVGITSFFSFLPFWTCG